MEISGESLIKQTLIQVYGGEKSPLLLNRFLIIFERTKNLTEIR